MKFKVPIVLAIASAISVIAMPSPKTGSASITWTQDYAAPEDAGITSMNVYYWQSGSAITNSITVATSSSSPTLKASVLGLTRGTLYFFAVTSETATEESDFGPVVSVLIPKKPNPPSSSGGAPN